MARRRRSPLDDLIDLPRRVLGEVLAHGWALPLIAFAVSCVISYTAGRALLIGGPEWWRQPAAALVFLAQWAANVCLLRARMTDAADRRNFLIAWAMCALASAGGLYHAADETLAQGWRAEVAARAEDRAPLVQALAAVRAEVKAAQDDIQATTAAGRAAEWPAERIERYTAASREVLNGPAGSPALGALARAQAAEAALNAAPALPAERPLDWLNAVMVVGALLFGGLEAIFYWSMLAQARREQAAEAPPPAPEVEALVANDATGVLIGLAKHRIMRAAAVGAGMLIQPTAASAASHGQPVATTTATAEGEPQASGQPSAEELADALLLQRKSRRAVMRDTGLTRYQVDMRAAALGLVNAVQ